jgi:anaerobic ribonucleoside-triphosphate reductase activating protein
MIATSDGGTAAPPAAGAAHGINLADYAVAADVLGPGRRAVVWVQGCPRRCPGCITAHMQRFDVDRAWVTAADLAGRILGDGPLEGLTLVGGEPFSHAAPLAELATLVRRAGLSVVTYSGHTYEQLLRAGRADWRALLDATDLLIDGEYLAAQSTDLLWRGSANQRLHFLSPRYRHLAPALADARGHALSLELDAGGLLRIIGIPAPGFHEELAAALAAQGVDLRYLADEPPETRP